jgi:peptidylprolyl isomerase
MTQAKTGDTVRVHYTGKLADGEVFDTSLQRDPIEFTIGEEQVIEGFEDAVTGMSPGDSKTLEIPAKHAYGSYDDELVLIVDRKQIPDHIEPELGDRLRIQQADGESFSVVVTAISDTNVTLDANHPLAGQDLTFDIQLVGIS